MGQCCSWDNAVHGAMLFMGQYFRGIGQCCSWRNAVGAMLFMGQCCRGNDVHGAMLSGKCCWAMLLGVGTPDNAFNVGRSLYLPGLTRWLPSHEAPLDSRLSTKSSAWQGVRRTRYVRPKNITKLWPGGSAMTPRSSTERSDPSSKDSIEPVRSQVSIHPPGNLVCYCEELRPHFADGPALVFLEIKFALAV